MPPIGFGAVVRPFCVRGRVMARSVAWLSFRVGAGFHCSRSASTGRRGTAVPSSRSAGRPWVGRPGPGSGSGRSTERMRPCSMTVAQSQLSATELGRLTAAASCGSGARTACRPLLGRSPWRCRVAGRPGTWPVRNVCARFAFVRGGRVRRRPRLRSGPGRLSGRPRERRIRCPRPCRAWGHGGPATGRFPR